MADIEHEPEAPQGDAPDPAPEAAAPEAEAEGPAADELELDPAQQEKIQGELDKAMAEVENLDPSQMQEQLNSAVVALYRFGPMKKAEKFWDDRGDWMKKAAAGKGILGWMAKLTGPTAPVVTATTVSLDTGIITPPEGMDMDTEGAKSIKKMKTLDKYSWLWGQLLLVLGPEAEAAVPVLAKIVSIAAVADEKYQDMMKETRAAVNTERERLAAETPAGQLGADEVDFTEGEVHQKVTNDLKDKLDDDMPLAA